MPKVYLNRFGEAVSRNPEAPREKLRHQTDDTTAPGTVYWRFDAGTGAVFVYRLSQPFNTIDVAYGKWADRASLAYVPCNGPVEVNHA